MAEPADADTPIQILRIELVGDELHSAVAPAGLFEDPAAWGDILAEIARRLARSLQESEGRDPAVTLRAIADAFAREVATDPGAGE